MGQHQKHARSTHPRFVRPSSETLVKPILLLQTELQALLLAFLLAGSQSFASEPTLPLGFPRPHQQQSNDESLVEIGRHLFYDTRLSPNDTTSCATCHIQALAFTDGKARSIGATGALTEHNAMSLVNLAYRDSFGWRDQHEAFSQLDRPLFAADPVEMGMDPMVIPTSILTEPYYSQSFQQVFAAANAINWHNIKQALVAFELTLVSGNSEYDAWVFQDKQPSDATIAGLTLFHSERLSCSQCHGGIGFNNEFFIEAVELLPGLLPELMPQLLTELHTEEKTESRTVLEDNGSEPGTPFRTPSLRNIEVTAPYMHDGRFETLEQVIGFYAAGPNPENNLNGFTLTETETEQLLIFLNSLSDESFLSNSAFGNPWTKYSP
ncbi:MAG: cytochrome c peroxidase [Candidatus Azotimanducaceae bacterium]